MTGIESLVIRLRKTGWLTGRTVTAAVLPVSHPVFLSQTSRRGLVCWASAEQPVRIVT